MDSLITLCEALQKYKTSELALSFNGGKDCTVVLHLVGMLGRFLRESGLWGENLVEQINYVHFVKANEFLEIQAFRAQMEHE